MRLCSSEPLTGYFRTGYCQTCAEDSGSHTVCVEVTAEFLEGSRQHGNDLMTPQPHLQFPGLKPGDRWCVCAARWLEAQQLGFAPPVNLLATHARALEVIPLELLKQHATA